MKRILIICFKLLLCTVLLAQNKKQCNNQTNIATESNYQKDKDAIKAMVGTYKVTFEFAETFAPDTSYKYHERKNDWGIEKVYLIEETDNKIILQHLLVVNDTMVVKHWRQDWIHENTELLVYDTDNQWKKHKISSEQALRTWTQVVYQVDDSPRYAAYGTWIHEDDRHFWEGVADSPLPRREITKRQDYNVLKRHSHIEIYGDSWILEQDNEKIIREGNSDALLCWEKGFETFTKGDYNCIAADDYWEQTNLYWKDVRFIWDKLIKESNTIKLKKVVDNKMLFEALFELSDKSKSLNYDSVTTQKAIQNIIKSYLI